MMIIDLQKSLNALLLALTVCFGLLMGQLVANWLGVALTPEQSMSKSAQVETVRAKKRQLRDFSVIGKRNLFDSAAVPVAITEPAPTSAKTKKTNGKAAPARRSDLKLLGTVAGGESPLAVIKVGRETEVFRVGDTLPGNLTLVSVARDKAIAESATGQETILELVVEKVKEKAKGRPAAKVRRAGATTANVVELGENRWQIPREEAEKARSNLNALLKTARMVPKIEEGATVGFTIVNIQPGTFLDLLGLKVGDVLVQINQVELNSPEKALQIFQQVREANNISLGLLRNGSRQTFEYTID